MRKIELILIALIVVLAGIAAHPRQTVSEARHRLPPVIYSIDFPHVVQKYQSYDFRWTVMGYHATYDINIQLTESNGDIIKLRDTSGNQVDYLTVSPHQVGQGQYSWGSIQSSQFFYEIRQQMCFESDDYIQVRFFASPVNDPINNDFLSVIIPGGLGYTAGDSAGRIIRLDAVSGPVPRVNPCP